MEACFGSASSSGETLALEKDISLAELSISSWRLLAKAPLKFIFIMRGCERLKLTYSVKEQAALFTFYSSQPRRH